MAEQVLPCNCTPHTNICCCGPINGISVVQPSCQNLPDGSVVINPAYSPELTTSFWTYKFFIDCSATTQPITSLGIPVCETIIAGSIAAFEKIDGCGEFTSVPFTLAQTDPSLGTAPAGYQWLIVDPGDRYTNGVCVEYRLQLTGDFPTDVQPIKVTAGINVLNFDCGCFLVPKCNPQGKLAVTKECGHTIINNQVTLNYQVKVTNIGNASLTNVQYLDTLFLAPTLGLGAITVNPSTLTVDTSISGEVKISGNLGTIDPGEIVVVTYTIPITSITTPRNYIANNTVTVTATDTMDSASCSTAFDAVQLSAAKCCSIDGANQGSFTITISSADQSPSTTINVQDYFIIPVGVTLQFQSFGGGTAVFTSSREVVPLNTNITGPVDITISCHGLTVPAGGSINKSCLFTVISSSSFGTNTIENSLNSITLTKPDTQVFLGAGQLPATADVDVILSMGCRQPCA